MDRQLKLLLLGAAVGVLSGLLGIGGGALIVPALVLLFAFSQPEAVGTSLAMLLPPIGIFAVLEYYRAGYIHPRAATLLAVGFALGAWGGAHLVRYIPERKLQLIFVFFMLYVAGNMLFRTQRRVWAVLGTLGLMGVFGASYLALRAIGRRWEKRFSIGDEYRFRLENPVAPDYEI